MHGKGGAQGFRDGNMAGARRRFHTSKAFVNDHATFGRRGVWTGFSEAWETAEELQRLAGTVPLQFPQFPETFPGKR